MSIHEYGPNDQRPAQLRAMIESWERGGLISADIAARALSPESWQDERHRPTTRRPRRLEVLGLLGLLGTVPVGAVSLILAAYGVGLGPVLLVGLLVAAASPLAMRVPALRIAGTTSRALPRHRATQPGRTVDTRGPKARELVLNGHVAAARPATMLASISR
jgi:hypothetical protein